MKVLHVGEYVKGGVATYINEVVGYQVRNEKIDDVYLILSKHNSEKSFNLDEKNIIYYDYIRKPKYILKAILSINKAIKQIKPDIVHVHSTFAGFFTRIPLFFCRKKPKVIYCSHGWSFLMEIPKYKKIIYAILEIFLAFKTDLIINISKNEYEKSIKYKLPKLKSTTLYNGISTEKKTGEIILSIDHSKINLLFVGRFDKQKGLDLLIDFFKKYQNDNINLYLIGSEILKNNNSLELPKNIVNLGWIDNSKIDSYYQQFDGVIMPSRWEGFGLVAIEAMKNRRALIVSNRGALPELVTDNLNGFVFDLDNIKSLEKILDTISKEQLQLLGNNGYKMFLDNYTSEVMNQKIIDEYNRLL